MQGFMQGLWIYPENTEVLGVVCKSLLKALQPRYQKIARLGKFRDRFTQAHQRQSGQRISGFEPA